jgi:hypothetical protein
MLKIIGPIVLVLMSGCSLQNPTPTATIKPYVYVTSTPWVKLDNAQVLAQIDLMLTESIQKKKLELQTLTYQYEILGKCVNADVALSP